MMPAWKTVVLVVASTLLLMGANSGGCGGLLPSARTGPTASCPTINALSCENPSIPNGGQCCMVIGNANAAVGYLCVYGADRSPAGCFPTLEEANRVCYAQGVSPTPTGIVRCTE